MLAIATSSTLAIIDPAILKRSPTSIQPTQTLATSPSACAWTSDNLYLASSNEILKYNQSSQELESVYKHPNPITHLVAKDRGISLAFSTANRVHVLEGTKLAHTFDTHKNPVTSLALSNDCTLLASTSTASVYVHNLSLASHTALRGLPVSAAITACAFHPHTRTRLLVGSDRQLLVYDTTRPSGPIKSVPMTEGSSSDEITAIACSPFSKTLVAVAMSGGHVGLVDLDKEKGLFRTLNLKVPIVSVSFSPEGAALHFTTENGKLLIMDLRALDKPPRSIVVSEDGECVVCMALQKKSKASSEAPAPKAATAASNPQPSRKASSSSMAAIAASLRPRALPPSTSNSNTIAATTVKTPAPITSPPRQMRVRSGAPTAVKSPSAKARSGRGVTSTPGKVRVRSGAAMGTGSPVPVTRRSGDTKKKDGDIQKEKEKPVLSPARDPLGNMNVQADEDDVSVSLSTLRGIKSKKGKELPLKPSRSTLTVPREPEDVPLPLSAATTGSDRRVGATSSASSTGRSARSSHSKRRVESASAISRATRTRTPSPDLPDPLSPTTPVPMARTGAGCGVLGLATPEVERWIAAGKVRTREKGGGRRRVGFADEEEDEAGAQDDDDEVEERNERELSMQISPRRPSPVTHSWSAVPSPLRRGASGPQDVLRSIVQDVMYDFQRDTKAELTGLHLDLVRLSRGWKRELRTTMGECLMEIRELREENRALREENERLRRGY